MQPIKSARVRFHTWRYKTPVRQVTVRDRMLHLITESPVERFRADTYSSKEPITLDWIDGMTAQDVLLDVGANVGLYTLYAAARGVTVIAVEAESANAARLLRHIHLNRLQKNVRVVCAGLHNDTLLLPLTLSSLDSGSALHQWTDGASNLPRQWTPTLTADNLCARLGLVPTHMKIDVDGCEADVLAGAQGVLKTVHSVLTEVTPQSSAQIGRRLNNFREKRREAIGVTGDYNVVYWREEIRLG